MKKTIIIAAVAAVLSSCSLNEVNTSNPNRLGTYENAYQAQAVVNSCYAPFKSMITASFAYVAEVVSDLWYVNTSVVDAGCEISPAKAGQGTNVWKYCYQGVMYCNECIEMIGRADFDEDKKGALMAEARVLRALYYYVLTNVFNGVPFYTYMVEDMTTLEQIRKLPRTDANEIRQALYLDLQENALPYFTEENGLKRRTSEVTENRAGYALALMLMAKFAMWYEDWDAALEPLNALEELYGEFSEATYPLDDTRWCKKNTNESIFEVQHAWSTSGTQYTSSLCRLYYPGNIGKKWNSYDTDFGLAGSYSADDADGYLDNVYMPEYGSNIATWSCVRATSRLGCFRPTSGTSMKETTSASYTCGIFRPLPLTFGDYNKYYNRFNTKLDVEAYNNGEIRGQKVDRRIRYVLGLGNYATGETFSEVERLGRPFAGEKFWVPGLVSSYDSNNYKLFRYADAILMMSECYCRKGDYEQSLNYMNMTRRRACVDEYSGLSNEAEIMSLIRDERARELAGELHRRWDLVRWGIWYESVVAYAPASSNVLKNIQPYHVYYPIPDTECALTGYILDNPDYPGGAQ